MKIKTASFLAAFCLLAALPWLQAPQKEVYVTVAKRLEARTEREMPAETEVKKMAKTETVILRAYTSERLEARTQRKILYEK
ncbi:MAG TPA: hypothetical protein VHO03_11070 [Ignavibacteriales bacterium]|nr:hypothetical protein [Ignavibacteriales bacterium]